MGADLKLLPRLLIHVRRTQHAVLCSSSWAVESAPRSVPRYVALSPRSRRRLVQDAVVVSLQPDANSFFSNHVSLSLTPPGVSGRKEPAAGCKPRFKVVILARRFLSREGSDSPPRANTLAFFARMRNRASGHAFPTAQFPKSFPRPPCDRLREWQNRKPFSIAPA